ncbi:hypothetical protein Hanom_Chr06g00547161 [Helianthus anomalus]
MAGLYFTDKKLGFAHSKVYSKASTEVIFESFYRGQYVASNRIDAFVDVLNLEEKKRDRKSSP